MSSKHEYNIPNLEIYAKNGRTYSPTGDEEHIEQHQDSLDPTSSYPEVAMPVSAETNLDCLICSRIAELEARSSIPLEMEALVNSSTSLHDENNISEASPESIYRSRATEHRTTFAPDVPSVEQAFRGLTAQLQSPQRSQLHRMTIDRLRDMKHLCYNFVDMQKNTSSSVWIAASLRTAASVGRGSSYASQLRKWTQAYIQDPQNLPNPNYHQNRRKSPIYDSEFRQMLESHLQSLGPHVRAQDVVEYVERPEILSKLGHLGLWRPISSSTAHRWMAELGYRWKTLHHQSVGR